MNMKKEFRGTFLHKFLAEFFKGIKLIDIKLVGEPRLDFCIEGERVRILIKMNEDENKAMGLNRPLEKTLEEAVKVTAGYYADDK